MEARAENRKRLTSREKEARKERKAIAKATAVSTYTAQFEKELESYTPPKLDRANLDTLKRNAHLEYISGRLGEYNKSLNEVAIYELGKAVAFSIVSKLVDPQKTTAPKRETVSDSGQNPMMLQLRKELVMDTKLVEALTVALNGEYNEEYSKNGDISVEYNEDDDRIINERQADVFGDGLDLVHESIVAILEQFKKGEDRDRFDFDEVISIEKPTKRVRISADDIIVNKTVESKPIVEAYRSVRRYVQNNGSVKISPNSKYTYIEDEKYENESGMEAIYRRSRKYADVGGMTCNNLYTATESDFSESDELESIIDGLNLTARQMEVLELRLRGYGVRAVADKLKVRVSAVQKTLAQIGKKWENR